MKCERCKKELGYLVLEWNHSDDPFYANGKRLVRYYNGSISNRLNLEIGDEVWVRVYDSSQEKMKELIEWGKEQLARNMLTIIRKSENTYVIAYLEET